MAHPLLTEPKKERIGISKEQYRAIRSWMKAPPAVDIHDKVSRVMDSIINPSQIEAANNYRNLYEKKMMFELMQEKKY